MEYQAVWRGAVLARSTGTIVVVGHRYFPPESLDTEYLDHSRTRSHCPWKGLASYYSVTVDGISNRRLVPRSPIVPGPQDPRPGRTLERSPGGRRF